MIFTGTFAPSPRLSPTMGERIKVRGCSALALFATIASQ